MSFRCKFGRTNAYFQHISIIFNREIIKHQQWMRLMWNYLLKSFAWHSAILLTQDGVQNGCPIIICLTLCFSRSIKWLLKQVIFHNSLIGEGHKNMYDTQGDTYNRFQTYTWINSMTPFEIKYHLRAILWKMIHISDTYMYKFKM